jgi:hypothetical protein
MPIRVNLKEIFPSDPQEINVDKVNFNFNKLLELGVGSPGPIGLTGPVGPAGPIGLVGPQGDRGATWWVDSGDPNTLTFTGLIDGDLYLDQTSTAFEVYQYDDTTSTWNSVVSIAAIVNAYLSTASPSPFTTGPTGIPATSTKFVVFDNQVDSPAESAAKYLDYVNDGIRGSFNSSNNKTLFLTNFDENNLLTNGVSLIWPANQNSLYTALFKVVVAHDDLPLSVKADLGRYHLEFGSLYNNGADSILSDLKHNLKGKFYKRYIGLGSGELPLTNEWINTAKFSLSTPEPFTLTEVDQNGEFEFVVPKYNDEDPLLPFPVRQEVYVRLGSAEAFAERTNKAAILADGISITNDQVGRSMVVGLREDLGAVLDLPYSSTNFALFDVSDDVDGLFFNKTLVQTGGNFDQLITTAPIQLDLDTFYSGATTGHFMSQGIWVGSNTIWLASGAGNTTSKSSNGIVCRYDISNPKNPVVGAQEIGAREITILPTGDRVDQHGHDTLGTLNIGLIKDVAEYGKYITTIHTRATGIGADETDLFIHETDSYISSIWVIGALEDARIKDAYRVQVHGKYAWIITNRTHILGPQTQGGALVKAKLTSVDISNPNFPVVSDSFEEYYDADLTGSVGEGTKYLDFDIKDGKAYVLRYTNYIATSTPPNSTHTLDLLVFDVQDPTNFSSLTTFTDSGFSSFTSPYSPQDSINLETLTVNTTRTEFGGLDTQGNLTYAVWEDSLYISEIGPGGLVIRSTSSLSAESMNACDVVVRGKYAYVLVNYANSTGAVQVWDISNKTSPFMVSEIRNANLANSSRLSVSGKYIYVVSNTGTNAELITLDITGIDSPSAQIGAIKTNDLQVSGNAHIKNNLQVKNSLNVGPGGIYIDEGQGLSSDGPIVASDAIITNISIDDPRASTNVFSGGFGVVINDFTQSVATGLTINAKNNLFNDVNSRDLLCIENTLFLNGTGATNYLRKGFVGNAISRAIGTQGYGHPTSLLTTAFTGSQISLGTSGFFAATDIMYGDLIGHSINLGPGVQLQANDAYGYKFNFSGSSTGTVYGLHIEGADENVIEGNTTVDSIQIGTSSKIKNEWHGWMGFTYNVSLSGNAQITTTDDYSSGLNLQGFTISATNRSCAVGLNHNGYTIDNSSLIFGNLKILSTHTFSNINNVAIHITPKYASGSASYIGPESTMMAYTAQVNTVNDFNIYWRSIVPQNDLDGTGTLAFYISIYEYNN